MMRLRSHLEAGDPALVRQLTEATGFFSAEEVNIAEELAQEAQGKGDESGYFFVFCERDDGDAQPGRVVCGFACFGPIPGSKTSHDLYWIVVHPEHQGAGVGRQLLAQVERGVLDQGGKQIYADTSGRPQYAPTHAFYERCGYAKAAHLENFYDDGDGKFIYVKRL